jgi:hypothetical protein
MKVIEIASYLVEIGAYLNEMDIMFLGDRTVAHGGNAGTERCRCRKNVREKLVVYDICTIFVAEYNKYDNGKGNH